MRKTGKILKRETSFVLGGGRIKIQVQEALKTQR